ncbi:15-hydroxyprostaglandin dehydrogenase [NAD(+)]-like [Odontomachus brunneus]|uniref:15-hydroxyprostaglandin dehydrogenase [NAD(+)]-like n=1 Tax=Odontomachus brunneus TaxID=486640 RepID=UPI0013F27788|nr:15-hydroxyprostaglandin dehydrogenase [NAD(+)]-like [Odontomachus brunneus]XP_032680023.1 15-hydroxyprostaglandin dehydrogenase [NAD(+)]-like [Odontomachus brunneus]
MDNVQNKTVMITGGAGGLGSEFVKIMLKNGAKNVAIVDLPTTQGRKQATELEDKYGKGRAAFFPCDIADTKEVETTFKKILDAFGELNIVVNNAGLANDRRMEQTMEVNVMSLIRISLLAFDHMGKHKGGKGGAIVNISSIFGLSSEKCGIPIYCASKYAVTGFSHSLANFHYISGVRILTLCPGVTLTPLVTDKTHKRALDFVDLNVFSLENLPQQTPDNVSRALLHLIQKGENGATWVTEDSQPPYAVDFPHYSKRASPV